MNEKKTLAEIVEDDQFIKRMDSVSNSHQFAEALNEFGIELEKGLSEEKAYDLFLGGQHSDEELSEKDLEEVSGGFALTAMFVGTWLLKGAIVVCSAQAIYLVGKAYGQYARRSLSR